MKTKIKTKRQGVDNHLEAVVPILSFRLSVAELNKFSLHAARKGITEGKLAVTLIRHYLKSKELQKALVHGHLNVAKPEFLKLTCPSCGTKKLSYLHKSSRRSHLKVYAGLTAGQLRRDARVKCLGCGAHFILKSR